jgi:hypothetical protein
MLLLRAARHLRHFNTKSPKLDVYEEASRAEQARMRSV